MINEIMKEIREFEHTLGYLIKHTTTVDEMPLGISIGARKYRIL